jgi:hypothetical protein
MTVCWTLGVELMSLVHCDLGKTTLFPLFLVFLRELTFAATEIVEGQLSIRSVRHCPILLRSGQSCSVILVGICPHHEQLTCVKSCQMSHVKNALCIC